jgi:hypothetical protein
VATFEPNDPEVWQTQPFVVGVLKNPETFWRLLRHPEPATADDLQPDATTRKRYGSEDHCSYRGFSAFRFEGQAREYAKEVFNPRAVKAGREPFTHLVSFSIDPGNWDACSWMAPPEGHFCIWGEAETLASSLGSVFTI